MLRHIHQFSSVKVELVLECSKVPLESGELTQLCTFKKSIFKTWIYVNTCVHLFIRPVLPF